MKTITQYREDIKQLMEKSGDINAQAISERRELTNAEVSLKNEILDKVEELEGIVHTMERENNVGTRLEKPTERKTVEKNSGHKFEVGADNRSKQKFTSLGEQMAAIMRAGVPGGNVDPRLYNATGAGESVPSDGGFLVQTDFSSEIMKQVFDTAVLASRCRRVPISGNSNSIKINGIDETSRATGSRYGGIRGYWVNEAAEKTASKPKFRQIELTLKKLIGLCYATDELLDDTTALEGIIREGFVSEFGFLLDDAIINGTGAGQPLGIMNAGCLVTQAKESGQDAATVMAENVMNMYSRLFAQSRQNAVWLINQNVEPQLFTMSLSVGTGGVPVYMPAGGLSGQPYATLFGRPVLAIEQAQTLGTAGDIILADMNGYLLAEKGGIKSDMSIHVMFNYDESVFRFVMRVDGQPIRSTPLTPYKGGSSATQSHFVTLATRS
jgi:HK97 family phage major capsid protein